MVDDYQSLAIEAVNLANSLLEENNRLRLSIALMKFKSRGQRVGRKKTFSDDDVLTMLEFYPKLADIYKADGKRLTQKDFATLIIKKMFPKQSQYRLSGKIKTMQNRMKQMKKSFNSVL